MLLERGKNLTSPLKAICLLPFWPQTIAFIEEYLAKTPLCSLIELARRVLVANFFGRIGDKLIYARA